MIGRVPFLALGVIILVAYSSLAAAASLVLPMELGTYRADVVSYKEAKFTSIIRQQYDYSCGSAAVASLLTYHYEDPKTEHEVFEAMWKNGDHALIKKQGFSLLDMKRYLENRGYRADGFRLSLDKLKGVGVPAITLINNNGYMHFVVVKGISDKKILLGDPVLGVRAMPRDKFEAQWNNGIIFLVKNRAKIARASFNREAEWRTIAKAPMEYAKSLTARSLADFNLLIPARSDM
jgi:predicted double-glycine peptidase